MRFFALHDGESFVVVVGVQLVDSKVRVQIIIVN